MPYLFLTVITGQHNGRWVYGGNFPKISLLHPSGTFEKGIIQSKVGWVGFYNPIYQEFIKGFLKIKNSVHPLLFNPFWVIDKIPPSPHPKNNFQDIASRKFYLISDCVVLSYLSFLDSELSATFLSQDSSAPKLILIWMKSIFGLEKCQKDWPIKKCNILTTYIKTLSGLIHSVRNSFSRDVFLLCRSI